jgi:hypothetical protein
MLSSLVRLKLFSLTCQSAETHVMHSLCLDQLDNRLGLSRLPARFTYAAGKANVNREPHWKQLLDIWDSFLDCS